MDERIDIADAAAAAVLNARPVFVDEAKTLFIDSSEWMFVGTEHPLHPEGLALHAEDSVMHLAAFVRDFPTAPLEALYRHARSHGVHDRPSDCWDDVPAAFRIAYAVFRATLMEADRVFAEEEARAAAKAAADKAQAPVMVRASETILEQHGTIFEKVGDPDPMVNLGGPVVAASEGDGGDVELAAVVGAGGAEGAVDPVDGEGPAQLDPAGGGGDPAPEAPRADTLEAEAKAVSPARRKR
jgi:hypothetical protein